jgi:DNA-binding response OmpR family regulator
VGTKAAGNGVADGFARRILIIDGEQSVRREIKVACEQDGYEVVEAESGGDGLREVEDGRPSIILLEVTLPDMSGFDVCRDIRKVDQQVPVIMLSSRSDEIDIVVGLEIGADDYVVKPVRVRELLARIAAHLRKTRLDSFESGRSRLEFKDLAIDVNERRVFKSLHASGRGLSAPVARQAAWTELASLCNVELRDIRNGSGEVQVQLALRKEPKLQGGGEEEERPLIKVTTPEGDIKVGSTTASGASIDEALLAGLRKLGRDLRGLDVQVEGEDGNEVGVEISALAEIDLTHTEFDLLAFLAGNAGKVLSREKILNTIWGYEYPIETRVIDVHIRNLRRKIESNSSKPFYILAVPGIGYRFTNARPGS